ncbi:1,4-alpha-glucan branching enzyme GlgB [Dirofilaria immitis]
MPQCGCLYYAEISELSQLMRKGHCFRMHIYIDCFEPHQSITSILRLLYIFILLQFISFTRSRLSIR